MRYEQARELIILPTLESMSIPVTEEAIELLLLTMAHESKGGEYLKQISGPALGIFQIEPATYNDIWDNYLKYNQQLSFDALSFTISDTSREDGEEMIGNLYYATAMARLHYYRVEAALPKREDYAGEHEWFWGLAAYAKRHYNTYLGSASVESYYKDYLDWRGV